MISDDIQAALRKAADTGTSAIDGKPRYAVYLTFDQLIALMERTEEWQASQNND